MLIRNGNIITPYEILYDHDILIENGIITAIGKSLIADTDEINASECYICPGLIDIHTHGGGGGDFMDASDSSFKKALSFHSKNGTTALLATSVTAPIDQITDMLGYVRKYKNADNPICRVLGAHIEGPYISVKNKGAQHESYLRTPKNDSYDFILENRDVIKSVTLSPELEGAAEMTRELKNCGIVVCGGHDDGEKDSIMPVISAGLSHCTHLFCAMSTIAMRDGVRSVGLCELGLTDDRLTVELICDKHHITPEMVRLTYKCKTADKMCAVSDSLRAGGMPKSDTLYTLGSEKDSYAQKFVVDDGVAKLPDRSRYAGSIQPLGEMLKNLIFDCGIPIVDAVKTVSLTPARIIGVQNTIGSLETGKSADIYITDKDFNSVKTIINGKEIF